MRISFDAHRLISMIFHIAVFFLVLEILGIGHLTNNPIVIGAILLSYYDLWIK